MIEFMTHKSFDAFKDMPVLEPSPWMTECKSDIVLCPKCQGHGGWNLQLDAYGPGRHFPCTCDNCMGHGWVFEDSPNAKCVHNYDKELTYAECKKRNITHHGQCWHVWECSECGETMGVDSSD